jgi:hypothetical protein
MQTLRYLPAPGRDVPFRQKIRLDLRRSRSWQRGGFLPCRCSPRHIGHFLRRSIPTTSTFLHDRGLVHWMPGPRRPRVCHARLILSHYKFRPRRSRTAIQTCCKLLLGAVRSLRIAENRFRAQRRTSGLGARFESRLKPGTGGAASVGRTTADAAAKRASHGWILRERQGQSEATCGTNERNPSSSGALPPRPAPC